MLIDVAFHPAEIRPARLAVVVDVLRATSTVVQALAAGYRRVMCTDSLARARALRTPARLLAGERRCVPPPDFDLGNSPSALRSAEREELVLTTTNGCPAIVAAARQAREVLLGCLLNLDAVLEAVTVDDVLIVCSGTDGRFALEDAYAAGRLVERLPGRRSDAAQAAQRLAGTFATPFEALAHSEDATRLRGVGLAADIEFCARESTVGIVPRVIEAADGVATAEPWPLFTRRAA